MRAKEVVLVLGETFTLGGSIALADWDAGIYEGERRILVSGWRGNLCRPLARLRDVTEGEWGPLQVPLDGSSRYTVRLEGAPILPVEETFDAPRPSTHRRVDFVADKGEELFLLVRDEDEKPITTAKAVVRWGDFRATTSPNHAHGVSRPDGYLYVGTIPPGSIMFEVSAPGYGRVVGHGQLPSAEAYLVVLPRAGRVVGRCLRDGKPVTDFEVMCKNDGPVSYWRSEHFLDRQDGSFEIDDLTPAAWTFMAADPAHPGGRPVTVGVTSGSEARIELVLPAVIRGGGRLVDAESGEPVAGASIQVHSSGGLERSSPWGSPVASAPDGTFDLDAFVLGSNYLVISAEGYATLEANAQATDAEFLDWGDLRLARPQSLRLSLLGVEQLQGVRLGDLRVSTVENFILPQKSFTASGTVQYDGVPPGDHRLVIMFPDDSFVRLHLQLEAGKDWSFEQRIAGDRRLNVSVVGGGGEPLSFDPEVLLSAQEETGFLVVRSRLSTGGKASFEGIRAEAVQAFVLDPKFKIVASQTIAFGSHSTLDAEIRIGEKPLRVRVVDAEGNPIPTAWITMRSSDGAEILALDDTGADGWAELVGLPDAAVLMDVRHGIAGSSQGVPIDASVKEHEFVLEAKGSLELHLFDGEETLAGVSTQIQTTGGVTLRAPRATDDEGTVRYEALGHGRYHIACRRADCWPAVVDHELGPDDHAVANVQMRRLAALELTVYNAEGLPISGVEVELTSSEFGAPVSAWLAEERVESSTGLRTEGRGRILVEGLPNGSYAWSVAMEEGPATGTFELAPSKTNEVAIRLVR